MESEYAVLFYKYFYRKFYGSEPLFKSRDNQLIINFLNKFEDRGYVVGTDFLYNYIGWQFAFFYQISNLRYKVVYTRVFGDKAIDRWFNRKGWWEKQLHKFTQAKSITKQEVMIMISEEIEDEDENDVYDYEEVRKSLYEKEDRLAYCINYTSLWNPKSKVCPKCSMKKECRIILKLNNKPLFNKRQDEAINRSVFK